MCITRKNKPSLYPVFAILIVLLTASSCTAYKRLPYLKGSEALTATAELKKIAGNEPKIKAHDILSITVNSTIPGAAVDFNLPLVPASINNPLQTNAAAGSVSGSLQNYLVTEDGSINFPVLGEIKLAGLTQKQAQDTIANLIYPRYISQKPIVNVRFINFQVSVLGEVSRPGIYQSANGQMTVLDALAAAGDMTIYGKRANVLLLRTLDNGELAIYRINMQDKNLLLNKDLFYMQQGDKLYVEQNKQRGNASRISTGETISISIVSALVSVASLVVNILR